MLNALLISLKNLFSPPATCSYPANPEPLPNNYRGLIIYEAEKCIFCMQCEEVCPPKAICFLQNVQDGSYKYNYNPYLCIYCGECVRSCPDKANALSQEITPAHPGIDGLLNEEWRVLQENAKAAKAEYKLKKAALKQQAEQ